jgi:hypothetical protein
VINEVLQPNVDQIEKFSKRIMELVETDKIGYIEAITDYCDVAKIEIEVASKLLSPLILSKVTEEAMKGNLIEKRPTLNFYDGL